MASAKELRTKMGSVKSTQKITRAMEMVAASKMRKAQDRMKKLKPYSQKIRQVMHHVARACTEYKHPFLQQREVKRVGYIIVSTDRGLCGGLNTNLFRLALKKLHETDKQNVDIDLCLIGNKADVFFRRIGANIVAKANHLGDAPKVEDLIGIVKVMLDSYREGKIDALYLCYNEFVNTMVQKPQRLQLLPVVPDEEAGVEHGHWDYIYEPGAKDLLDRLLTNYIESQVYQAVVENLACQQAATMVAMKNATDNAGKIIDNLRLAYNKARQATITREISEIISGADAVS